MKKTILKALLAMTLLCGLANAANLVTYTAGSSISQKDADQKALEGVAKQISTKVKSELVTKRTENAAGDVKEVSKSFKGSYTNVILKGAKIVPGAKKNGMFQSTVTVDLDQLASMILLNLESIRQQMNSKDSVIRLDMSDRDYYKAASGMAALERLGSQYNDELENLSCVQAVPKNLRLESTLAELTEFLKSSLATIKIDVKMTEENLLVSVTDFAGPVENFPMILSQDRKDLVSEKTDASGVANFSMKDVRKHKAAGEVVVLPDMNFSFVNSSALVKKSVSYESKKLGCAYRMVCIGAMEECGSVEMFLNDVGFTIENQPENPTLDVALSFNDKPNLNKTLVTSEVTARFRIGKTETFERALGVGRSAEDAHVKSIAKLPASKVRQKLMDAACKQ